MKLDTYLDKKIGAIVKADNDAARAKHKSSGKLSASGLNDPLQWQMLHSLGIEGKEPDEYTLRKFLRGNQVEDWYVSQIKPIETQKFVEYRETVGYVDAIVDTALWDFPSGVIPFEIKSVSNMKFKRIDKQGPDKGHKLQAGFYAVCLQVPHFGISYVATDDYRIKTFILDTHDIKEEIDGIVTKFLEQKKTGLVPKYEAREKWQSNPDYCRYPEWMELDEKGIAEKLKVEKAIKEKSGK
jgi:hypothetical protein